MELCTESLKMVIRSYSLGHLWTAKVTHPKHSKNWDWMHENRHGHAETGIKKQLTLSLGTDLRRYFNKADVKALDTCKAMAASSSLEIRLFVWNKDDTIHSI